MNMSSHRAGPLKQQNKSHKHGKHKSKSTLEGSFKGRSYVVLGRMITVCTGQLPGVKGFVSCFDTLTCCRVCMYLSKTYELRLIITGCR